MIKFFKSNSGSVIALSCNSVLSEGDINALSWLFDKAQYLDCEEINGYFVGPTKEMNWTNEQLKAIEEKIRQLYPKSYHSDYLDDYRKLLEVHLQAQYESSSTFDISHLFENDDYISYMTIKDVDANYWESTISDVCFWTTNYVNSDIDFIVDVL